MALQRRRIAAAPCLRAVVVAPLRADEADATPAAADQVLGHRLRRREIGIAHHHVERLLAQVAGFDDRDSGLDEQGAHLGRVQAAMDEQRVRAMREESLDQRALFGG